MSTVHEPSVVPDDLFTPEELAAMQAAIERAYQGIRDPEAMQRAYEGMDRIRQEIYERVGLMDVAVPAIRAFRDGDDE
jgi:hypothetical protein